MPTIANLASGDTVSEAWVDSVTNAVNLSRGVILTDAAQACTSGVMTDVTWGTEVSDVDGWTSGGIATLTVPTGLGGRYIITYTGGWLSGGASTYEVYIYVNGVITASYLGTTASYPTITFVRTLAATNTIKVAGRQSTGGSINLDSRLEVAWLADS